MKCPSPTRVIATCPWHRDAATLHICWSTESPPSEKCHCRWGEQLRDCEQINGLRRTASVIEAERGLDRSLRWWQTSKSARAGLSARCNYRPLFLSPSAQSHCSALVFTPSSLPLSAWQFFSCAGPCVLWLSFLMKCNVAAGLRWTRQQCRTPIPLQVSWSSGGEQED